MSDDRKIIKQRQVMITEPGGPDVLDVVERDVPHPAPGMVRIKVLATGVAFADVMMRRGKYPNAPKMPFVPGYDLAGTVEALGAGVPKGTLGRKVLALIRFGANAQYVNLPAEELVGIPRSVDPVKAACLPLNYVTAFQLLHRMARVKRGERILVHGAAGGVGTAILQLGRLAGLDMYGTASKWKHDLVASLGAEPIDYRTEDFVKRIRSLSDGGVDVVLDHVGGEHFARSYRALRRGGRLIGFGVLSAATADKDRAAPVLIDRSLKAALKGMPPEGKSAYPYAVASLKEEHPEWFREDIDWLLELLAAGRIEPIIAERLPLEGVKRAHELLDGPGVRGKLLLLPNG